MDTQTDRQTDIYSGVGLHSVVYGWVKVGRGMAKLSTANSATDVEPVASSRQ